MELTARDFSHGNWFILTGTKADGIEIKEKYQSAGNRKTFIYSDTGSLSPVAPFADTIIQTGFMVEPIKLTLEILEKSGFGNEVHFDTIFNEYYFQNTKKGKALLFIYDSISNPYVRSFEFVHELQSWYYLGTGKELEIKF